MVEVLRSYAMPSNWVEVWKTWRKRTISYSRISGGKEMYRHGHTNGKGYRSREYRSWESMIRRCTKPQSPDYKYYGARGITVCPRWLGDTGFINFFADLGPRPSGTSLDRIDNEGNYEPSNCRWADEVTQKRNRRPQNSRGYRITQGGKFSAYYNPRIDGRNVQVHLGIFLTAEEAHRAHMEAKCAERL